MKLTFLSKMLIVLVTLGALATGVYVHRRGQAPPSAPGGADGGVAGGPAKAGPKRRIVVGVNDFGGAYPGLAANDGALPGPSSLFAQAGLDVEIRLVRGSKERLEEFDAGKIDVMLLTLDYVANLYADYHAKGEEVQAFQLVDWSRGNMGLVTKPRFASIESLKTARIATTRNTPTHYFLLTLLDRSNLKAADIEQIKSNLVFAKKTPLAGEMFQRGEVDAVAIWEPHLSQAVEKGGGKLLVSTTVATNLVADVLFARQKFLDQHADVMPAFIKAWLGGVARTKADPERTVRLASEAFKQTPGETRALLGKLKLATFADNRAFFGLETETSPAAALLTEAGEIWKREGVIQSVPDPKKVVRTKFLEAIAGDYRDERVVEEFKFTPAKAEAGALFTKSLSIYFDSGSADLDANARRVLDGFAGQVVGVFQNAYVRVEGNTDNVGSRATNRALSGKRAQAVVDYLVQRHRFDPSRFVAVGNGPDRPVADNKSAQGREYNRRTDFRIVPNY